MWNNQNLFTEQCILNFSWSQLEGGRLISPYWSLVSDFVADSTYAQLSFCTQAAVRWYLVNNVYALARAFWLTINCLPSGGEFPRLGQIVPWSFYPSWHSILNMWVTKTEYWISSRHNIGILDFIKAQHRIVEQILPCSETAWSESNL